MYCKKEFFTTAIDYEGKKIFWKDITDIMMGQHEEGHTKFVDMIECASLFKQDRQKQNILSRYELRDESKQQQQKRETAEDRVAQHNDRAINFPMYNMTLSGEQFNKLFHGKAMRVKRGNQAKRRNASGISKRSIANSSNLSLTINRR